MDEAATVTHCEQVISQLGSGSRNYAVLKKELMSSVHSFFNPSLRTAVTVLDELPAQNRGISYN
jgi:hypothetical protein